MSSSSIRWTVLVTLSATIAAAMALVFLLAVATNNRALYEQHFSWLLWVNVAAATVLVIVVSGAAVRLALRLRRGQFGSRLLFKLAATFALVGVLPGVLIYLVSYQFVSRSIESWFDVQVEGALESGLTLGRNTIQVLVNDVASKTRVAAERASEQPERLQVLALERLREQLDAQSVAVLGANGQVLVAAGGAIGSSASLPSRPDSALLREARGSQVVTSLEGLDDDANGARGSVPPLDARIRAIAWVRSSSYNLERDDRYLQVTQSVPTELAKNALAVQSAYSEYQQRALGREGLRRMYIGTLTLTLILAVFSAMLLAALLGHQLARPLLVLAEGVRRVAGGDLSPAQVFTSRDELGGLTRSFADMTQQLAEARSQAQRGLSAAEKAKTHLQTILDNLTAGVIVFDAAGRILSANPGAERILQTRLLSAGSVSLDLVPGLQALASTLSHRQDNSPEGDGEDSLWQDTFEIRVGTRQTALTLLVRWAPLPEGAQLMVFDDITDVVSAQRSVAWAEVARRLAHEIKNPLTPIQLSAERLQVKLEHKLEGSDQQMLHRSISTIVNQVQAMKQLVNEFRDYSRLPNAKLVSLDLNQLVSEVLTLYSGAQDDGRLETRLSLNLPAILGDSTQLRQVVHNLVQNALDAVSDQGNGLVIVSTDAPSSETGDARRVRLVIEDNGPGFPDHVLRRAFEPYVTTKARGTGLGLAVVKKIADEHGARITVRNLILDHAEADNSTASGAIVGARVSLSFSRLGVVKPPTDSVDISVARPS